MKLKSAVIISVVLHSLLIMTAYFFPDSIKSEETAYYVDLYHIAGTGSDSGKGISNASKQKQSSGVKDLVVEKEKTPELAYPDNVKKSTVAKKEKEELVSVVKRKDVVENVSNTEVSEEEDGGYLRTGLSGTGSDYGNGGSPGNFPYSYYVDILKSKIQSTWYNPLASSGISGKFLSVVYFRIFRDGSIGHLKLRSPSGNKNFDLSTVRVIREVTPFPPLPPDYPEQYLGVYFEFEWER